MRLFANGKIHMGEMWRIFAVVLGLLAPQFINATSSISHFTTASGFVSNVLPSISASDLSSTIQNVTASTNGGISTTEIPSTFALNATAPVQVSSSTPLGAQPSINSSLETKTSVLSVSETRTLYHSTTVVLGGSQNASASQASTGGVIRLSTIRSSYYLNSSAETLLASSALPNPKQSSNVVSEIGTSNVLSPSSVSEGNQSTASSLLPLGSSVSVNTTSLTSVVSSAASPSSYVSATRTLPLTQSSVAVAEATSTQSLVSRSMTLNDTASYGSSTGLPSQSMAATSLLGLGTSHTVLSSLIAMATSGTLSTYSTSSMFNNASKTDVKSPLTPGVSATILVLSTTAKSAPGSSNDTVVTSTMSETMVTMVNSSVQLVPPTMTTAPTSKAAVSPTAFLSVSQATSSMLNSTLQPSAVLSSVRLGVNQTSSIAASSTLSPSGQVPSHNQTVTTITTSTALASTTVSLHTLTVAALSSSSGVGLGSSTANATIEKSSSLKRSVAATVAALSSSSGIGLESSTANATVEKSSSLKRSVAATVAALSSSSGIGLESSTANATVERSSSLKKTVAVSPTRSRSSSSVQFNTSSKAAPSSAVDVGVVSSTAVANETSRPFSVLPSLVVSQNATSQSVKTLSLSSSMSGGLTLLSMATSPSPSLTVTPNKTSTNDGFVVLSSSYSCYIYYVVEMTVFPVTTANQSIVAATIPKVTLDIGSTTSMHSELPTVTLTHPVTMTTQVSEVHSQVVVTSGAPDSTRSVGLSSGSIVPTLVSLKSSVESMLTPSQPPILPSATVTKVLITDTHKATQTDSSTGPSIHPSVSIISLIDTRSGTASTSKEAALSTHLQPESSQQQSGTSAIPSVTPSVGDLPSSTMENGSLGSSPATSPSRFSPIVATPSVSDKPNVTTSTATGTLFSSIEFTTKQKSAHSTHGGSSVAYTSSVQSGSFVNIVTPSVPSQSLNFVSTTSEASQVISNSSTSVIQVLEGSLLPSSTVPSETPKTSIPSNATLLTTQAGTSSESHVLTAATSTASVTQSRNASVTSSLHVLVTNTTGLSSNSLATISQVPTSSSTSTSIKTSSIVGSIKQSQISSSSFVGSSKMSLANSNTTVITSVVEATKSSSSSTAMVLSTGIQTSPNTTTSIAGQFSSVMPSSSGTVSQVGSINTFVVSTPQVTASSVMNQSSASSIGEQQSSMLSSSGTALSQVGAASFLLSTSHQTAVTSSLSHVNNQSASSVVVVPSLSDVQVSSRTASSFGGHLPSVLPSSSGTMSQNGSPSTPVSSSPQMALSSSLSHAVNTTSAVNSEPSSTMLVSSLTSGSKRRRKKRAVGDNSTSVIVQLSSTTVTASVAVAVASTGLPSSSESTSIPPTSSVVSQNNSVIQTAVGGSSHDRSPTSLLSSSGQPQSISTFLSSQSTSTSLTSSQQVATSSQLQGNLTVNATGGSSSMFMTTGQPQSISTFLSSQSTSTSLTSSQQVATSSQLQGNLTVNATGGSSSMFMTTGQPQSISTFLSSQSTSTSLTSSQQQVATSSQLQGNFTVNATGGSSSMFMTTGSASSSVQSSSPAIVSHTTSTAQIPSSVPISVSITPSGTLIQSHGLVSSFHSPAISVNKSSETVRSMTVNDSSSATQVVGTMALSSTSKPVFNGSSVVSSMQNSLPTSWSLGGQSSSLGAIFTSTFYNNGTVRSLSSVDLITSSAVLSNSNSTSVLIVSSSEHTSSAGVTISSMAVGNGTMPSTSLQGLMTSSAVLGYGSTASHSVKSLPSLEPTLSAAVNTPSTVVGNGSLPSTTSMALMASSAMLDNSTLSSVSLSRKHASLIKVVISSTVVANGTSSSSLVLMRSSMLLGNSTATVATDTKQPSTLFTNASVTASSSSLVLETSSIFEVTVPSASSASLGRRSSSLTRQAHESTVMIAASPLPTKVGNVTSSTASSSLFANKSVVSTTELLSSQTTNHASQTLKQTFSSSHAVQPSPSTLQSGIQQTITSSSVTIASSSNVYKPPLVTMSSLGICYVVYTTRLVQPTLVPTPQVNMSSTASVNASSTLEVSVFTSVLNTISTQVLPTVSLNTSSVILPSTLTVNVSSVQSSIINATAKPSESSFIDVVLSTVPAINSSALPPATKSSQEAQSSAVSQTSDIVKSTTASSLPIFTAVLSRTPTTSVIEVSSFVQTVTSEVVSSTHTVTQAVSSSVTVPTTQPPDQSLLMETTIIVDLNTDIESPEFQSGLESNFEAAYSFSLLPLRRRRRAFGNVNATIQSIQRLNNGNNVNVIFFITKDGQRIPASQAAQNYNRLSKGQFAHFIKLDVVSMPQPLVKPSTSPAPSNRLVSLIIQDSDGNNISIPANKAKLESNLASYYKDKKQLQASTIVTATIQTILHEPNEKAYLEFYISVGGKEVNKTDVVETFKVSNVNLLTAQLGFQVLVPVYVPDSLAASESDHVIIGISVNQNQDLKSSSFRSELANKLVTLYVEAKGRKNSRRKRRSGSTSATIVDVVRNTNSAAPEADVTFFMFDSGTVVNGSYVASVMNRLSTGEMTTFTMPYAVLNAPRAVFVPTTPTEVPPTVTATPIKWWIIPAVICPILLIIVIILLVCWRWKKGAPKTKVEPDTIRMLESNTRRTPPVHGFDVARYTEPGVSGMKTTSFTSGPAREEAEETKKPARRGRETSLRRKVGKPPVQKLPTRQIKLTNPAYEEEDESVASETPPGSMVGLMREKRPQPPSATKRTAGQPRRHQEPQRHQELSDDESEEESEVSGEETETERESVAPPAPSPQTKHSAAQVPTVAVMGEASGPPRYPPVRFRSSVHPAPSLPPLNAKQTSLVGVKVEPPSDDDARRGRKKGKVTKRELEQRADLERQKNKQRLRDRKRDSARPPVPSERRAWDRAQHDFDDVLADEEVAERVITGKREKRRRRRPPSSSVATDEEGAPHLKSYRKLKSPKTTASSTTSTRDHGKKHRKSEESVSNASSDESEIDMNETRRRMHAMLDDAFSLFGPHSSMKHPSMEPEGQSPQPEGYPAPPARAVVPRYIGGHPALPEPPPAHGRATEPTPGQRRRVQPTMPGYPAAMPQTPIGVPGYPGRPPVRPVVTRDPIVVWDPADRQRILNQRAPPPTFAYRDPSGQNMYITPVHQQRGDMGGLVWSPYVAEDSMDALYPDLAQASYPGALGTSPPKDTSYLSHLQTAQPHDTILNMSPSSTLDQRGASLGQSPQPLIKSIKGELFRLSQGATRKTPITEL